MADWLHDADASQVRGFFAEGDPFRRYKSAIAHSDSFADRELEIPESGWQQALLFSARRGEAIIGFVHLRQAIIQVRPSV